MGVKAEKKADTVLIIAVVVPVEEKATKSEGNKVTSRPVTDAYCQGWESIFGKKQEVGQA